MHPAWNSDQSYTCICRWAGTDTKLGGLVLGSSAGLTVLRQVTGWQFEFVKQEVLVMGAIALCQHTAYAICAATPSRFSVMVQGSGARHIDFSSRGTITAIASTGPYTRLWTLFVAVAPASDDAQPTLYEISNRGAVSRISMDDDKFTPGSRITSMTAVNEHLVYMATGDNVVHTLLTVPESGLQLAGVTDFGGQSVAALASCGPALIAVDPERSSIRLWNTDTGAPPRETLVDPVACFDGTNLRILNVPLAACAVSDDGEWAYTLRTAVSGYEMCNLKGTAVLAHYLKK